MNQWQGWVALTDRLKNELLPHIPADLHQPFFEFIDGLFLIVSKNELERYEWDDLVGSTLYLWKKLLAFKGTKPLIDVFNPSRKKHGWQCEHTVIYVIQKDMPFMVDSLRMKLQEKDINIYQLLSCGPIVHKSRGVLSSDKGTGLVYIEIGRIEDKADFKQLKEELSAVLVDVYRAVRDYSAMKTKILNIADSLQNGNRKKGVVCDMEENQNYLRWLLDDNFTFLGFEEINVIRAGKKAVLDRPETERLGVLQDCEKGLIARDQLEPEIDADFFSNKVTLSFAKGSVRSTVHRPAYPDFIIIKRFDDNNEVIGESRILGLYTSPVFSESVRRIPILNKKFESVVKRSRLPADGYAGKELAQIIEVFPREELFQISEEQLFNTAMSILQIQERNQTKVFLRRDRNGLFCSVLIYVPRDVYSTDLRVKMQKILCERLQAVDAEFFTFFSESLLARVHFILRLKDPGSDDIDLQIITKIITKEVVEAAYAWQDGFRDAAIALKGETQGIALFNTFRSGFSVSYKESFSPEQAVLDVIKCDGLNTDCRLKIVFYQLPEQEKRLFAKVFSWGEPLPLADQIPVMENMGLKVISEHPYTIRNNTGQLFWIHDFSLIYTTETILPLEQIAEYLQQTFYLVWYKQIENDGFNRLVTISAMNSAQVAVFRAYAHYTKQIKFGFSQSFIASTLYSNVEVCILLWELFQTRFDVDCRLTAAQRSARQQQIQQEVYEYLEHHVNSLSEDRILRRYVELIMATLRTNFYQCGEIVQQIKDCISFKIAASELTEMPKPVPQFEIFVYSPRFEGVHLRGGKVARGGLRWSDRIEDFRTEILGLVKAQQVKNSVIVPVGAKGGFVCKRLPADHGKGFMDEGISCYKQFIRSLLDVTDNFVDDKVVKPERVICYDDDDYYLVVAADKGTATFSDIANSIAAEYQFWLGDAFASGGSVGYDHKKMGITAKGAWVSVKRHFAEMGINIDKETITVIGIGDMSGDVFGNGMLLSEKLALQAGFNHQHIFIDPDPDIKASFTERQRLFSLPRSSWSDYKPELISKGGGCFSRSQKAIIITPEMQQCFKIKAKKLTPSELICALLKAPVDLIWNGGIGTYIKASTETSESVGDHANDALRVNGNELRCRVIGEGGNLGLTQLGRVEYALNGGVLNTDFIDNAGGVDCSDHEVNIKILLNSIVTQGKITHKQRNKILEKMTEDVSALVLKNNYRQAQTISIAHMDVIRKIDEYRRLIHELELQGNLDRAVEFLPDEDELNERVLSGKGLTRPELSLLVSYSKGYLKELLLASDICDDEYIHNEMLTAFPRLLREKYSSFLFAHRLKREITATQLANYVCNTVGFTFINRLEQFTGAKFSDVLRAFIIIRDIYGFDELWASIESLDHIKSALQLRMMADLRRSMRRLTRWILQMNLMQQDSKTTVDYYFDGVQKIMSNIQHFLPHSLQKSLSKEADLLKNKDIPEDTALKLSCLNQMSGLLFIVQVAREHKQPLEEVARAYFYVGELLSLGWCYEQLNAIESTGQWYARARENIRDEMMSCLRQLVIHLFKTKKSDQPLEEGIERWKNKYAKALERWHVLIGELKLENKLELAMLTVLGRKLLEFYEQITQNISD